MKSSNFLSFIFFILFITSGVAFALPAPQTPATESIISVKADGVAPFDGTTFDPSSGNFAGTDADDINDIVRNFDLVTYNVEVSINNADDTNLLATVVLNDKAKWVSIPLECRTLVNFPTIVPDSQILDTTGDGLEDTLICNLGDQQEGRKLVIMPVAQALGNNGDLITASSTSSSDNDTGTNQASGPVETTITAGFGIGLSKSVAGLDLVDEVDYTPPYFGADVYGVEGKIINWRMNLRYNTGSEFLEDDGSGNQSFTLTDTWVGTHSNDPAVEGDNANGITSDGVLLFGAVTGNPLDSCSLVNPPAGASVTCSQPNPGDPITIQITGVPVSNQLLASVSLNMFIPFPTVFDPGGIDGGGETYDINNFVTLTGWGGIGTLVTSQSGTVDPGPEVGNADFPVSASTSGLYNSYKTFDNYASGKSGQTSASRGETIPTSLLIQDFRTGIQTTAICDTLDTASFEFAGDIGVGQFSGVTKGNNNGIFGNDGGVPGPSHSAFNPQIVTYFTGALGTSNIHLDPSLFGGTVEFSDVDYSITGDDHWTATCEDDLDGDGSSDWVTDYNTLPGGAASVIRVRLTWTKDYLQLAAASVSGMDRMSLKYSFDLKIKETVPIGVQLPNTAATQRNGAPWNNGWLDTIDGPTTSGVLNVEDDPTNALFSFNVTNADRVFVVPSSMGIRKEVEPIGQGPVVGGDSVIFTIDPRTNGVAPSVVTMTFTDTLPSSLEYVSDTCEADYAAVGLTCVSSASGNVITFTVSNYTVGDPLPPFEIETVVLQGVAPGTITNSVEISSDFSGFTDDTYCDDAVDRFGNPSAAAVAGCQADFIRFHSDTASVIVLGELGFGVEKEIEPCTFPSSDFTTTLKYYSLGGDLGEGQLIDIIPNNDDGFDSTLRHNSDIPTNPNTSTNLLGNNAIFVGVSGVLGETFEYSTAPYGNIDHRPCHPSNWAVGEVLGGGNPVLDVICSNGLIDPVTDVPTATEVGTGATTWGALPADPTTVTAFRATIPAITSGSGELELLLTMNVGAAIEGDLICNNFGANSPAVTLDVISNDVCIEVKSGSIGDVVWYDTSNDGVQDTGEPGLANIGVKLLDGAGNPIYIDPVTDTVVSSTYPGAIPYVVFTDSTGAYLFENLPPGDFQIMIDTATLPPSVAQTYDADGAGDDMSAYTLALINDPITGEPLDVEDNDEQDFGYFVEPSSLGSTVWLDDNQDGIFDGTEAPVAGVTVTLSCFGLDGLPGGGDDVSYTTTTDASGNYLFENLLPFDYQVNFTPPAGFSFTGNDEGSDDSADSDADPLTGLSPVISLVPGENRLDVYAGLFEDPTAASLGDTVWFDTNEDGVFDSGEAGASGVSVSVTYFGPDGVLGGGDDQVFTTITDANGNYLFTGLEPGEYKVTFTPPTGYGFTSNDLGGDDTLDSDADPITGMSPIVTLNAGDTNLTIDAGLIESAAAPGLTNVLWNGFCDQQNFVSMTNICTESVAVTVALYGSAGDLLSSQLVNILGGQQIDFSINAMAGFSAFDYGRADLLSMPGGCITGAMGLFAPIGTGQLFATDIEFSSLGGVENLFAMSDGSMSNACYMGFNTFQPSLSEEDSAYPTTHWLQLVNLESEKKLSFTVKRFDMLGAEVSSEEVIINPNGRLDIAAGHEDEEIGRYGLIEVIPSEQGANYTAELFRYGMDTTVTEGERMSSFTLADNCSIGEAETQYATVSKGAGAATWLEIHNINRAPEDIIINVFSNTGGLINTYDFSLEALETVHFDAGEGLLDGESGVAEVRSVNDSKLLVKSTSYLYRADGKMLSAHTSEGRKALGEVANGSYNSFRNQLNWLRVFNVGDTSADVTITGYSQLTNEELGKKEVVLRAERGQDIDLNSLFGLGNTEVGRVKLTTTKPGALVADILRSQHGDSMDQLQGLKSFSVE